METQLPYPRTLFPIPEDQEVKVLEPIPSRAQFAAQKLLETWEVYGGLVQDEKLWKILNEPQEAESDSFYLQRVLAQVTDRLGLILSGGHFQPRTMVKEDLEYLVKL